MPGESLLNKAQLLADQAQQTQQASPDAGHSWGQRIVDAGEAVVGVLGAVVEGLCSVDF